MKIRILLFSILALVVVLNAHSTQKHSHSHPHGKREETKKCGTDEYFQRQLQKHPNLAKKLEIMNARAIKMKRSLTGVLRVPVVVHVVYNTLNQNISDQQIQGQIEILNKDFRRNNSDANANWPQAADSEIEFYLAKTDPNWLPTTGITRTSTSQTSFSDVDEKIKFTSKGGKDGWDETRYLNVWVGNLEGILGYAQFPGAPNVGLDGVVINTLAFGVSANNYPQYNMGRTITHEMGHYFNLRHIWGDAPGCSTDDLVEDTPLQDDLNYGCPLLPVSSCGGVNMVENYMDYVDDGCMNIYTEGQKTRMRTAIELLRLPLIQPLQDPLPAHCGDGIKNNGETQVDCGGPCRSCSYGCDDGIQNNKETGIDCGGNCRKKCPIFKSPITVFIQFDSFPGETSYDISENVYGSLVYNEAQPKNRLGSSSNTVVTPPLLLNPGSYFFTIRDSFGDGISGVYGNGFFRVLDARNQTILAGGKFGKSDGVTFIIGAPDHHSDHEDDTYGNFYDNDHHHEDDHHHQDDHYDHHDDHNDHHDDDHYDHHNVDNLYSKKDDKKTTNKSN